MGISVQQWRSAIGNFYQDSFRMTSKNHKSASTHAPRTSLMIVLTMTTIFSAFSIYSYCVFSPLVQPQQLPRSPSTWSSPWISSRYSSTRTSPSSTPPRWRPSWCSQGYRCVTPSSTWSKGFPRHWPPLWPLPWHSSAGSSSSWSLPTHAAPCTPATQESHLFPLLHCIAESLVNVVTNFQARYTNGNRSRGIKICHWNKGGSFLVNKMPEIKNLISQHHPH